MKTSEFIKQFCDLDTIYDITAAKEEKFLNGVVIKKFGITKYEMVARLPEDSKDWHFYGNFRFSPEMLELMTELAKTPPEEREEQQKYVILNGLPRNGTCYFFIIDDREGRLVPNLVTNVNKLEKCASFSDEALAKRKLALTPELATAVDMMKVTFERAIELTEKSKHEDLY